MEKRDVIKIINQISGCDGSDDYARGWDDACKAILEAVEERGGKKPDGTLCTTKA